MKEKPGIKKSSWVDFIVLAVVMTLGFWVPMGVLVWKVGG